MLDSTALQGMIQHMHSDAQCRSCDSSLEASRTPHKGRNPVLTKLLLCPGGSAGCQLGSRVSSQREAPRVRCVSVYILNT